MKKAWLEKKTNTLLLTFLPVVGEMKHIIVGIPLLCQKSIESIAQLYKQIGMVQTRDV